MKKTGMLIVLLLAAASLSAQSTAKHVRRIYVDELHFPSHPELDASVRSKLISSLAQDCASSCTVVEGGEDTADAVLTGSLLIQTSDNQQYRVQGTMRLVDKNGTVIWAAMVYSSAPAQSIAANFADYTAKKLTAFLAEHQ
jgi:hypothetical protein